MHLGATAVSEFVVWLKLINDDLSLVVQLHETQIVMLL